MDFHFCYVHHVISIQMFYKRMCSCNIDVEKERKKNAKQNHAFAHLENC